MKNCIICLVIFFIPVCYTDAQTNTKEKTEDTTSYLLDEIIITAQRNRQKQVSIPYSVSSISENNLRELSPRTTPEALAMINGIFVQKTNHGGGSPFIRGLTGNQTLILVDGIRLNNSTFRFGPNQYLNTIDAYSIHKIEVAKGTGSVQYGTDALGGVIQVFTKDPGFSEKEPGWSGTGIGKYMTGDMEKTLHGEANYGSEKIAMQIGATYRNFGDLIGGDTTGKQSPSGYKELAFDAKTKFLLKQGMQLTLAHQFLQQQDVPVYHKILLENFALNEMDLQQRMLNYAKLHWQSTNQLFRNIEFISSWQQGIEGRQIRKNNATTLTKEKDRISTIGLTADIFSIVNKVWTANSGVEAYIDKVNSLREEINTSNGSKSSKRGLYPDGSKYSSYSLYSLHHFHYKKLVVEAGLRFNTFSIRISDTTLGDVKITPSALVGNTALMYNFSQQHHLYISFSTGYRAPNTDDMGTLGIVDFRYEIPTADLEPERSQHTEIGYKFKTSNVYASISGYYMHLDNLITRVKLDGQVINGYPVYKKENIEKAYIKGVEAEINWQLVKWLSFAGGISYTYGQNLTKKEPLRRIPPFNGRVITRYHAAKLFGAVEFLFASRQDRLAQGDKDDNRIPSGGTPGWKLLNLYAGYNMKRVQINLSFQNLFNEDYRTHGSGINGTGSSGWLSVSYKFGD